MEPIDLRTEHRTAPLGLDDARPRLGWRLAAPERGARQTAYQVEVEGDGGPLWDSGRVESDAQEVAYGGPALTSRGRYRWRVRVAGRTGALSEWSEPASWEMGLLQPRDWRAAWIGGAEWDRPWLENVPLIRHCGSGPGRLHHRFECPSGAITGARLAVSSPGSVTAFLNSSQVTGEDVAHLLRSGVNQLTLEADEPVAAVLEIGRHGAPSERIQTSGRWWTGAEEGEWPRAEEVGIYGDPPHGRDATGERPSPHLRRTLTLAASPRRARLYVTALGLYELAINGRRAGDDRLAPGWTDYHTRLPYQTHDVTGLLHEGDNVVDAVLGAGWYAGSIAWRSPGVYGTRPLLRAQLEVELEDGSAVELLSDGSWQVGEGAIRFADLQLGEVQDLRRVPGSWCPVDVAAPRHGRLVAAEAPPIRVLREISPVAVTETAPDRWIYDFGQNLVGWARLKLRGQAGQSVILRHAEVLEPDGALYLENLRAARQTDQFTLDEGEQVLEPHFTVHGFRYLEVSGVRPDEVVALVTHADMAPAGEFSCSHEGLNQLQRNIVWGQRGNFLSVPTDCPQRDERLGWTGDAQIFAATAAFNMDVRGFFAKWLNDLIDAQRPDGAVPHVAPNLHLPHESSHRYPYGAAGWGDAVVIVPWVLYRTLGDRRIAEDLMPAVERWLRFLEATSTDLIRPASGFGDWLSIEGETRNDLIGTAFFAWSAHLASELADGLGRQCDAARFEELFQRVRLAFRDAFVDGGGRLAARTQTAYVLALRFGLFDQGEIPAAADRLVKNLESRNWHLGTGFLGTPHLLPVLADTGHIDAAYRLLLQETWPSWLYPVRNGATTVWERWDSWSEGRGFQDPRMNSFNHYAYGAVGEWMYGAVAGIEPAEPGYRAVRVRPRPGGGLTSARALHHSPFGPIAVEWRAGEGFELDVDIPPGSSAEVWIPAPSPDAVTEGGRPAAEADGVSKLGVEDRCAIFQVGSGAYRFAASRT